MKILKLKWRNFTSYGNKWHEINLKDKNSFNHLFGENGTGKTSIKEVLEYGIYGKVENKNLSDLLNRFNESNLEVHIDLISSGSMIHIERGMKPNILKVWIDGKTHYTDIPKVKEIQSLLETEYIKIPHYIFTNIIVISIDDFKSFLKMKPKDKRMIIDRLFGLDIINDMNEVVKSEYKKIKNSEDKLENSIDKILFSIDMNNKNIDFLLDEIEKNKKYGEDNLRPKIDKLNDNIKKINTLLDKLNPKISELESSIESNNKNIYRYESNIDEIKNKIKVYESGSCPTCNSDLSNDNSKDILNGLKESLLESEDIHSELINSNKDLHLKLSKFKDKKSELSDKFTKFNNNLIIINNKINETKNDDKYKNQLNHFNKLNEDYDNNVTELSKKKKIQSNKLKVYEYLNKLLSEDGAKRNIIKKIIPNLNVNINKTLKELGLRFILTFDENFNAILREYGKEVSVATLSKGQSKSLDLAVLITILRLMKSKYPGLNILFLDEVLASLDSNVTDTVIKLFMKISRELNNHIFLVNHAPVEISYFDYSIQTSMNKGFSSLKIEKIG